MAIKIDLTGQRFGSLTVIELAVDNPGEKKKWKCLCDCGNTAIVTASNLRSGHTHKCPECNRKDIIKRQTTHNMTGTKLYGVWNAMMARCYNKNAKSYADYGGRGIDVCSEWHNSSAFLDWAKKNGYEEHLEIDRIDTDKGYCPENCRWIPRKENANNKRNNKRVTFEGETKTLAEWAGYFNVNYKNLCRHMSKGDTLKEAVEREQNKDRTHRGSKKWLSSRGQASA